MEENIEITGLDKLRARCRLGAQNLWDAPEKSGLVKRKKQIYKFSVE